MVGLPTVLEGVGLALPEMMASNSSSMMYSSSSTHEMALTDARSSEGERVSIVEEEAGGDWCAKKRLRRMGSGATTALVFGSLDGVLDEEDVRRDLNSGDGPLESELGESCELA